MIVRNIISVEVLNDNFGKMGNKFTNEFDSEKDIKDDLIYAISCALDEKDIESVKCSIGYDETNIYKKVLIFKRYNNKTYADVIFSKMDTKLFEFKNRFNKKMSTTINKAYESKEDNKLIFDYSKGYVDYKDKYTNILFPVGLSIEDMREHRPNIEGLQTMDTVKYVCDGVEYPTDIKITNIKTNGKTSIVTFNYFNYIGIKLKTSTAYINDEEKLKDVLIGQLFIRNLA